jgi:predicted P-loop ATPase
MSAVTQETKSVTDYLTAIVWDGTPRIDRWLVNCAGAEDTPYVRAVSRMMLVAAVRRARDPGCRFDQLPVLAGPQGCGKSAALRVLAIEDAWFSDVLPLSDDMRHIIEATEGKWIVEASELESLLRGPAAQKDDAADDEDAADAADAEEDGDDEDVVNRLKVFLSRTHDEARMAYQQERTCVPRAFVVVGTTGQVDYLQDTVGNRRIVPVHVQRFDLDRLRLMRDQLWAEAAIAEAGSESIWLDVSGEA